MLRTSLDTRQMSALTARLILGAILSVYLVCGLFVALGTPAWEANDEPDHLRNVESLVTGEMYRIGPNGGLESHQPPLYYLLLAGYQRALGVSEHSTRPSFIPAGGPQLGLWDHDVATDGASQRFVTLMRITGLIMGAGVIVLTYLAARLVMTSRLSALIAAAIVATLPKFVFLSGVVNNDNLVNVIGAAVVYMALRAVTNDDPNRRQSLWLGAGLGLLVGAALATKLTAVALVLPAAFAAAVIAKRARSLRPTMAVFAAAAVLPSLPWVIFTAREYDDPLAGRVSGEYFDRVIPGLMRKQISAEVYFDELPKGIWKTFWYSSGWNQYSWNGLAYLPFWLIFLPALALGIIAIRRRRGQHVLAVLTLTIVAALTVFVYIGTITTGTQARVMFVGLSAIAIVVGAGLERLPVAGRLALPVMSLIGTLVAIRLDVVHLFINR